jgi:hypothetical protein
MLCLLSPHLSRLLEAGEGAYGVRKRSFRLMLKLTLQHSKNGCFPFSQAGEGGLWSAEAQLPPDAEADASALQKWLLPFLAGGRGGIIPIAKPEFTKNSI